ncbi:hypothetical protein KC343_g392 [Hortaea werneckii]|nr:hypothetical protein KC352_g3186 [Hortaea werneckii]KAI7571253.1 hypothetical protein KC317_g1778 [Hortaea werneckii]KAI7628016.1 hypothetical protein KC346_g436 [Hortaea werneckii]KAI7637984.1 hypothetical protein KC343_g392 [Hortaea werneckii]KAI7683620.1 hypothetical protein KC319_g381 [Hortaea werneckii]
MSSSNIPASDGSYFENQRALLVNDVAASLENVLQNINKLNRSLEGVIAVGNEFSQVEGLWSQFENVMAKQPEPAEKQQEEQRDTEGGATETPKR